MMNRYFLFAVLCCALLFCTLPVSPSFGCMQVKASEIEDQPPADSSSLTPAEPEAAEQPESSPDYTLLILAVAVIVLLLYFVFGGGK